MAEAMRRLRPLAAPIEPVVELCRSRPLPPAHVGGVILNVRHALDAAREHNIARAGLHHHRGGHERLETAAAAPVRLKAGYLDRKSCVERDPSADARRLGIRIRLRKDDIFDELRIKART